MSWMMIFSILIVLSLANFWLQRSRMRQYVGDVGKLKKGKQRLTKLHSRPRYYGYCGFLWVLFPALIVYYGMHLTGLLASNPALSIGIVLTLAAVSLLLTSWWLGPKFNARNHIDNIARLIFVMSAISAISITVMIVGSILFESLHFFQKVPFTEFLFGTHWNPQSKGNEVGSFGAIPVFLGTILITFIAILVAAPLGLLSAIYLSEYASHRVRAYAKPLLEMLAGIPTVVYGYFAVVAFAPFLRNMGVEIGLDISSESALAAGMVMGIMIIPFVMSLSDDVMSAVPYRMREASFGLGATKSETIKKVILPAALPGVISAVLLAISRAIGETMIVVMAAGLAANLTVNPLESVTTVTVQIVTMLVGDQEFDSAKTLSAFALSLTLFAVTLMLNLIAMMIVKRFREQYD